MAAVQTRIHIKRQPDGQWLAFLLPAPASGSGVRQLPDGWVTVEKLASENPGAITIWDPAEYDSFVEEFGWFPEPPADDNDSVH